MNGEDFDVPQIWANTYEHCGQEWTEHWDSTCDDRCPVCNTSVSPIESIELPL